MIRQVRDSIPDPRTTMTDPAARLATALAARYRIERELGLAQGNAGEQPLYRWSGRLAIVR